MVLQSVAVAYFLLHQLLLVCLHALHSMPHVSGFGQEIALSLRVEEAKGHDLETRAWQLERSKLQRLCDTSEDRAQRAKESLQQVLLFSFGG